MHLPKVLRPRTKPAPRLFSAPRIHAPKTRTLRLIEGLVLISVLTGTIVSFLNSRNFSLTAFLEQLPRILTPRQASESGRPKDASFEEKILFELQKISLSVEETSKTAEGNLLVITKDNTKVYFASDKDPSSQVRTLQTVLAKARIESKKIRRVDFRFENLVVEN
jgi:hypothetical protein